MDVEASIREAWCLTVFKLLEIFSTELLFHRLIRRVKIKLSSKSVGPVVLISSNSICESEGSNNPNKHSAIPLVHNVHCLCSLAIHRPSLGLGSSEISCLLVISVLFTMILSTKLHLPFLLFTLFKTFHIFLRLSLLSSIFLCNNQASIFSEYSRLCYLNAGRLVEDTSSLFC